MDILMTIFMHFAVILSLLFIIYVAHQKPSRLCSYLIIYSVAVFMNQFGYLMEIKSQTLSAALMAVKFEYVAGCTATVLALFFIFELFHLNPKIWMKLIYISLFFISGTLVVTNEFHHLHYTSVDLVVRDHFSALTITCGPVYIYHTIISLSSMAACVAVVAVNWRREQQKKKDFAKYMLLVIAAAMPFVFFVLRFSVADKNYDLIPLGLFCTDVCFVLIIQFFHIFDVAESAKNEVLENMEEGVLVSDEEGNILFANQKIRSIFTGCPLNSLTEVLLRLVPETDGEFRFRDHVYVVTESEVYRGEKAKGKTLCLFDVTQTKEKEKQLREFSEVAMAANKAKSSFLANMSHEIRTPINTILGMDEMIRRESSERVIQEYADDIQTEGKVLLSLIDELLDFSKIESGKIVLNEKVYRLTELLKELLSATTVKAKQKGLTFQADIAPDMPSRLLGDELRIYQVLSNLLGNALKYTEKGSVKLTAEWRLTDEQQAELIFRIRDTGIGIEQESLPYIYEKYSRLDFRKDNRIDGSGLGLNITKQLLELMHGSIHADSELDKGSVFTVRIPQTIIDATPVTDIPIEECDTEKKQKRITFLAPAGKILVVDDNRMNRIVVKHLLKRTELVVDEAENGADCLKKTESTSYDLILMDHMMQEMDGIEAMREIRRQNGKNRTTPVIVLTANAVIGARETYLEAGFCDYLSKPVSGETLERTLLKYLPEGKVTVRVLPEESEQSSETVKESVS